jgi:hypothetical protein
MSDLLDMVLTTGFLLVQGQANPEEVFLTIETLLPTGKGALLELFAPLHAHREGWVHIAQIRKS